MCAFSLLLPTVKAFCPSVPSKHIPTSGVASRDPLLGREIRDSTRVAGEAQLWHCVLEALVLMGPSKPIWQMNQRLLVPQQTPQGVIGGPIVRHPVQQY